MGTFEQIWDAVRRIPPGKVATYGQVARLAGLPVSIIERAKRILTHLEMSAGMREPEPESLAEKSPSSQAKKRPQRRREFSADSLPTPHPPGDMTQLDLFAGLDPGL